MTAPTPDAMLAYLTTYFNVLTQDHALMAQFRAKNPVLCDMMRTVLGDDVQSEPPPPLPHPDQITALQDSIFDNWPKGKPVKSYPHRYKMSIKAWDLPGRQINFKTSKPCFTGNASMMTATELLAHIPKIEKPTLKHPISPAYANDLRQIAAAYPDCLIGPILTKGRGDFGTVYHDSQIVVAELDDKGRISKVTLAFAGQMLDLPPFSPLDSAKKKLKGKVIGQSRWSEDDWLRNRPSGTWVTG